MTRIVSIGLFFIIAFGFSGCVPSPNIGDKKTVKRNLIGKWVSHEKEDAGFDNIKIKNQHTLVFYQAGKETNKEIFSFMDKNNNILAKYMANRTLSWKVKGSSLKVDLQRCQFVTIKDTKNMKIGLVKDVIKSVCKYATYKENKNPEGHYNYIYSLKSNKLVIDGKVFFRSR